MEILNFFVSVFSSFYSAIWSFSIRIFNAGGQSFNPYDIYSALLLIVFFILPVLRMLVSFNKRNVIHRYTNKHNKKK